MKRLNLADFTAKQPKQNSNNVNQLLGQVLGDCHDDQNGGRKVIIIGKEEEEIQE